MHPYHQEIVEKIQARAARENACLQEQGNRYIGTKKPIYLLRAPVVGEIFKEWVKSNPDLIAAEYVELLDSLSQGVTSNEFIAVGLLLGALPQLRKTLKPCQLGAWLEHAEGWAEVDSICQSCFTADEVLSNWKEWKTFLTSLTKSRNVHKRRASLVFLTKPLRESDDPRLSRLAFANIGKLKKEKDILITKAVSWVLRALVKYHRAEVKAYLRESADTLPKIAVRETQNKLKSGRKSGH